MFSFYKLKITNFLLITIKASNYNFDILLKSKKFFKISIKYILLIKFIIFSQIWLESKKKL
jgi:hypothetical protein